MSPHGLMVTRSRPEMRTRKAAPLPASLWFSCMDFLVAYVSTMRKRCTPPPDPGARAVPARVWNH